MIAHCIRVIFVISTISISLGKDKLVIENPKQSVVLHKNKVAYIFIGDKIYRLKLDSVLSEENNNFLKENAIFTIEKITKEKIVSLKIKTGGKYDRKEENGVVRLSNLKGNFQISFSEEYTISWSYKNDSAVHLYFDAFRMTIVQPEMR